MLAVKAKPKVKLKLSEAIRKGGLDPLTGAWLSTDDSWHFFCAMKLHYPDVNDTRLFEIKAVPYSVSAIGAALIAAHADLETYCWDDAEDVEALVMTTFPAFKNSVPFPDDPEHPIVPLLWAINTLNRESLWTNEQVANWLESINL